MRNCTYILKFRAAAEYEGPVTKNNTNTIISDPGTPFVPFGSFGSFFHQLMIKDRDIGS